MELVCQNKSAEAATGCGHLQAIVDEIEPSVLQSRKPDFQHMSPAEVEEFVDEVARENVMHTVAVVTERSEVIRNAVEAGEAKVVGALYDIKSGEIEFF